MPGHLILVLNAGSTGLKFGTYIRQPDGPPIRLHRGQVDDLQTAAHAVVRDRDGKVLAEHAWTGGQAIDHRAALQWVMDWLAHTVGACAVTGVGHRVLTGGSRLVGPTRLTVEVLDYLDTLAAIEPSHQAVNVAGARALASVLPAVPQVACFDTAFHHTLPAVARTYALPQQVRDLGVHRWGYHGLSYDFISRQLPAVAPRARRVIVAHLGGGASLCALRDGQSVDTSMGFSALSGLPMATRCGDLPPEVLLFLLRGRHASASRLETLLYEESGLLGLSGISADMRLLQASTAPAAVAAVAHFVYHVIKFVGAYAAVLGGLDALVFTAGIGEHSAPVRAAVCAGLSWLGLQLDPVANAAHQRCISAHASAVGIWVIPTDEEGLIAQYTEALLFGPARLC